MDSNSTISQLVASAKSLVTNSSIYTLLVGFTNNKLVPELRKINHTSDLVNNPISTFISAFFAYGIAIIVIYEIIKNLGIKLGWWKSRLAVDETAKHTGHVMVCLNTVPDLEEDEVDSYSSGKMSRIPKEYMELPYPIMFHFDFKKEEFNDPVLGMNLKSLRQKILDWFLESQMYYLGKDEYRQNIGPHYVMLYDSDGNPLNDPKIEEELLMKIGIKNGHAVNAMIAC